MNDVERRKKIKDFIAYWDNREIGERKKYQNFWNMLLQDIFEVNPYGFIEYEKAIIVDGNTKFIDGFIKETRRSGGMHYTSIENIHKVIDSLFLNDIKNELLTIKEIKQKSKRDEKLKELRDKISNLNFLDTALTSLIQRSPQRRIKSAFYRMKKVA